MAKLLYGPDGKLWHRGGKLLYSGSGGHDCCCQEAPVCLFCPPGSTPHSVFVSTTTPIELNTEGCSFPVPLFPLKIFSSELSGEWELTNSEANPCQWVYVENYPFSSLSAESYEPEFSFQCFGPIRTDLQFWIVLQTGSFGGQWAIDFYITTPAFGTVWAHDLYHSGNFAWNCGTDVEDLSNTYTTFAGDRPGRNGAVSLLMDVGI